MTSLFRLERDQGEDGGGGEGEGEDSMFGKGRYHADKDLPDDMCDVLLGLVRVGERMEDCDLECWHCLRSACCRAAVAARCRCFSREWK